MTYYFQIGIAGKNVRRLSGLRVPGVYSIENGKKYHENDGNQVLYDQIFENERRSVIQKTKIILK